MIPVIYPRLRFGMESVEYTERTCTIVVEIEAESGAIMIGIVVDSVSEVLNIKAREIEDTAFGAGLNTDFILGMAKLEGSVKILLEINRVLRDHEIGALEKASNNLDPYIEGEKT